MVTISQPYVEGKASMCCCCTIVFVSACVESATACLIPLSSLLSLWMEKDNLVVKGLNQRERGRSRVQRSARVTLCTRSRERTPGRKQTRTHKTFPNILEREKQNGVDAGLAWRKAAPL